MKKGIGKNLIGIVIIGIFVFIGKLNNNINNNKSYTRPDYDYIAIIYHREILEADIGTEYTYCIYRSAKDNNKYFYIKSSSDITIAGLGEKSDVGSGALNDTNDLKKIMRDIEKDSIKNSQTYISYLYVNNGNNEKVDNISELENKLFGWVYTN